MKRLYLFTLEVAPVEVGKVYDELPSHLTLMSRFWSGLPPDELTDKVRPLFEQTHPVELIFSEPTELGPKKLTVHLVKHSEDLARLHNELRDLLDSVNVVYQYPQFIGGNHKPHVTKRAGVKFDVGDKYMAMTACLVEVVDKKRVIKSRFKLGE